MPIKIPLGLRRMDYDEFAHASYAVMEIVFGVHNEFGRLFDEVVYKQEIAGRLRDAVTEVPIEVSFKDFRKVYYLDLVFAKGSVFEFKAVEALTDRHRAQLLNYLLLADLLHGKLVNLRPESVDHEFVNAALRHEDRIHFAVDDEDFIEASEGSFIQELMVSLLNDWGVGLDLELYEEALTHFLGGEQKVLRPVGILGGPRVAASQTLRLAAPGVAFKISALGEGLARYESHLRRFLMHTPLECVQWINEGRKVVAFKTIKR